MPINAGDLALAARNEHGVHDVAVEGDTKRLTIEPIDSVSGQLLGYVAWAESTGSLRDLLRTVSIALVAGGILVAVLAFAAGWRLARRALAPVVEVTDTARAISLSGDFAARVEAGPPGDEISELAVAFNEMLSALEANHQALQRFLGDASHQLRTPLTTIRASLDLAQRLGLDETERRAILGDAQAEAGRMARLIGDLLALARADAGARLSFAPVEIDAVLLECVREQRQAAQHVRMTVEKLEPAIVDGNRDRLKELFLILLENGARYTPAGGSVSASLEIRDGQVVVGVADTGIGIDEADRAHLFERLYRGHRAREMRPSGTGLGLAIAHWIAEAHGGTIALEPHPGGGTLAVVTLPERMP